MKVLAFLLISFSFLLLGADYDDIIPGNKETLVFVRAGCSGCELMKPIVKELINEDFNIRIVTALEIHEEYLVNVVPTTIVLVNGKEIRRHVGTLSKKEIITLIKG